MEWIDRKGNYYVYCWLLKLVIVTVIFVVVVTAWAGGWLMMEDPLDTHCIVILLEVRNRIN